MARTMRWPPLLKGGRAQMVEGADATVEVVKTTLSDLQNNPFNPDGLSLGQVTFRPGGVVRGRITSAVRRLNRILTLDSIDDTGVGEERTVTVNVIDRETMTPRSVTLDG